MWMILVWLFSMVLAPMVASGRGNSPGWAFFWALLLGPLGVLVALILPRDQAALDRYAVQTGAMRKCPDCAELVKSEAARCRFCGAALPPLAAAPPAAPPADWPGPKS